MEAFHTPSSTWLTEYLLIMGSIRTAAAESRNTEALYCVMRPFGHCLLLRLRGIHPWEGVDRRRHTSTGTTGKPLFYSHKTFLYSKMEVKVGNEISRLRQTRTCWSFLKPKWSVTPGCRLNNLVLQKQFWCASECAIVVGMFVCVYFACVECCMFMPCKSVIKF